MPRKLAFESLPVEVKTIIFDKLAPADRLRAELVCHEWKDAVQKTWFTQKVLVVTSCPSAIHTIALCEKKEHYFEERDVLLPNDDCDLVMVLKRCPNLIAFYWSRHRLQLKKAKINELCVKLEHIHYDEDQPIAQLINELPSESLRCLALYTNTQQGVTVRNENSPSSNLLLQLGNPIPRSFDGEVGHHLRWFRAAGNFRLEKLTSFVRKSKITSFSSNWYSPVLMDAIASVQTLEHLMLPYKKFPQQQMPHLFLEQNPVINWGPKFNKFSELPNLRIIRVPAMSPAQIISLTKVEEVTLVDYTREQMETLLKAIGKRVLKLTVAAVPVDSLDLIAFYARKLSHLDIILPQNSFVPLATLGRMRHLKSFKCVASSVFGELDFLENCDRLRKATFGDQATLQDPQIVKSIAAFAAANPGRLLHVKIHLDQARKPLKSEKHLANYQRIPLNLKLQLVEHYVEKSYSVDLSQARSAANQN